MPARNENNPEDIPAAGNTSVSAAQTVAAPPSLRRVSPQNVILFLDNSQDARTTRSAIQRHTAHHAAAQRREARLQSSRELTPRNLEWQRRTSPSSESVSPLPLIRTTSTPSRNTRSRQARLGVEPEQTDPTTEPGQASSSITQDPGMEVTENQEQAVSSPVLRSIGDDDACNIFLQAFQLALYACTLGQQDPRHWQAREQCLNQINRGLIILRQRLGNEQEHCSDQTIQAVLVIFVFASSFQTEREASSHKAALERMIDLRGGLASFGHNEILEKQLQRYAAGEIEQILHVTSGPGQPP